LTIAFGSVMEARQDRLRTCGAFIALCRRRLFFDGSTVASFREGFNNAAVSGLQDVRETRKYLVEANDYGAALVALERAQEDGDEGSFVAASTISFEVQRLDEAGNTVETYPAVSVE
jgi:hypothetical protein